MIRLALLVVAPVVVLSGCANASGVSQDATEHDDCVAYVMAGNHVHTSCGSFVAPPGTTFQTGREYDLWVSPGGTIVQWEDDTEFWKRTKRPTTTTTTKTKTTTIRSTTKSTKAPTTQRTTRATQYKPPTQAKPATQPKPAKTR